MFKWKSEAVVTILAKHKGKLIQFEARKKLDDRLELMFAYVPSKFVYQCEFIYNVTEKKMLKCRDIFLVE